MKELKVGDTCFYCKGDKTVEGSELYMIGKVPMYKSTTNICPICEGTGKNPEYVYIHRNYTGLKGIFEFLNDFVHGKGWIEKKKLEELTDKDLIYTG